MKHTFHIAYSILLLTIMLVIIIMVLAPVLLADQPPQVSVLVAGAYYTLAVASAAALCMTAWLMLLGKLLQHSLPWHMTSPRVVSLLALAACVIFLTIGAELLIQQTVAIPVPLALLLNILRLTPLLLLLTQLIPATTKRPQP